MIYKYRLCLACKQSRPVEEFTGKDGTRYRTCAACRETPEGQTEEGRVLHRIRDFTLYPLFAEQDHCPVETKPMFAEDFICKRCGQRRKAEEMQQNRVNICVHCKPAKRSPGRSMHMSELSEIYYQRVLEEWANEDSGTNCGGNKRITRALRRNLSR